MVPHHISLCSYPGAKAHLAKEIVARMTRTPSRIERYCEPFFGGGSVGLKLRTEHAVPHACFNDLDPSVICMWKAASEHTKAFKQGVRSFTPGVSEYERIKRRLLDGIVMPTSTNEIVRTGVEKLALQKMSWSSLGQMAGPRGGWKQRTASIGSKWNAEDICRKIDLLSPSLRGAQFTSLDFADLFTDDTEPTWYYLDPPYWEVGNRLYQYALSDADHVRLRDLLFHTEHHWILSYNDCPEIRGLYDFADIEQMEVSYTMRRARRTHELLITPRNRIVVGYRASLLAA